MNVIDCVVIILSFGSTGFGPGKKYPNLTPIRMLRWFYKKNSHNEDLGEETTIVVRFHIYKVSQTFPNGLFPSLGIKSKQSVKCSIVIHKNYHLKRTGE
jgi:hypothetical protein